MREVLRDLNKRAVSEGTGISYSRLRKYAAAQINELTKEEREDIAAYLSYLATIVIEGDKNEKTKLSDT